MGQQPTLADYLQRRINLIHEIRAWIRRPEAVPAWRKRKREILRLAALLENLAAVKNQGAAPKRIATLARRANRYKGRLEIGAFLPGDGPGYTETILRVPDDFQVVAADRLIRIANRLKSKAKRGPKDHLRAVGELVVSDLYHDLRKKWETAARPFDERSSKEREIMGRETLGHEETRLFAVLGENMNLLSETSTANHWQWISQMLYGGKIDGAKIRKRTAAFKKRHGYHAIRFWKVWVSTDANPTDHDWQRIQGSHDSGGKPLSPTENPIATATTTTSRHRKPVQSRYS